MNSRIVSLIIRRLAVAFLTLLIVSFIVFAATALLPGDTAMILLGQSATPEAVAGLRKAMNLDEPALLRFLHWLWGLMQGDLGTSYANKMPVAQLIGPRFVNSIKLAGLTTMIAVPLALTLGITSAAFRGSTYDRVVTVMTIGIISVPEFMIATLAVLLFAVYLQWLPNQNLVNNFRTRYPLFFPANPKKIDNFPEYLITYLTLAYAPHNIDFFGT